MGSRSALGPVGCRSGSVAGPSAAMRTTVQHGRWALLQRRKGVVHGHLGARDFAAALEEDGTAGFWGPWQCRAPVDQPGEEPLPSGP
ncbi:hypothetical protein NDU88_002633 [Pleurodeles waltl]|uniref:Uncharacterized protein n=1 Tax=Pleurodeles waltl TaxID=8319 RepID=A0AAV7UZ15_PLEWA|nr:hypothetical protein NDU88_002633 [Pleurodeles waltl]